MRRREDPRRLRRGFSTAETICAAFVVSVVMMALFNLFPTTAVAIRKAEMRTYANGLAQRELETLRAVPFDDLDLGAREQVVETYREARFRVDGEVFTPPGAEEDLLKGIRIRVSWTDKGRSDTVSHEAWRVHVEE